MRFQNMDVLKRVHALGWLDCEKAVWTHEWNKVNNYALRKRGSPNVLIESMVCSAVLVTTMVGGVQLY